MCFWSRKCRVDCGFFIARERVVSILNELAAFLPFSRRLSAGLSYALASRLM